RTSDGLRRARARVQSRPRVAAARAVSRVVEGPRLLALRTLEQSSDDGAATAARCDARAVGARTALERAQQFARPRSRDPEDRARWCALSAASRHAGRPDGMALGRVAKWRL